MSLSEPTTTQCTKPIVMRLSPPEEGDERKWKIVGYHMGRYPIYEEVEDEGSN